MTSRRQRRDGWRTMAAGALLALAACTSPESDAFPEPPQPKITVTESPVSLTVALPGPGGEFARAERARAASFLDAYRDGGRGPLSVTITAPDARSAGRADAALRLLAIRRGVAEDAVAVRTVVAATGRPGIVLRYTDFVAVPPACNPEVALSRNPTAEVSPNLGCALERGIAAMVAHPADLRKPVPETPEDGARLGRVIDLYRQGKATQAEVNRNDDVKASTVTTSGANQ